MRHCRSACPAVLFPIGLLPPCLKGKNSWMCAVGLNPTHSEQQVPEACFCPCHNRLHTVAAAVGDRRLKSIRHVHPGSPQQEAAAHAPLECCSLLHGLMAASSCFCSNLKVHSVEKPSRGLQQSLLAMKGSPLRSPGTLHTSPQFRSVC